jgi:hypothetical protein
MAKKNWRTKGLSRDYGAVTVRIDPSLMRSEDDRLELERQAEVKRKLTGPLLPTSMRDVKQPPTTYVVPRFVR